MEKWDRLYRILVLALAVAVVAGVATLLVRLGNTGGVEVLLPTATTSQGQALPVSTPNTDSLMNINSATALELETLPQIGPVLAQAIVSYREQHGAFATVEELLLVKGIGPATLEKLRDRVTVGER